MMMIVTMMMMTSLLYHTDHHLSQYCHHDHQAGWPTKHGSFSWIILSSNFIFTAWQTQTWRTVRCKLEWPTYLATLSSSLRILMLPLSAGLFVCLSFYLFVCLSVCLFVCLSFYLFVFFIVADHHNTILILEDIDTAFIIIISTRRFDFGTLSEKNYGIIWEFFP